MNSGVESSENIHSVMLKDSCNLSSKSKAQSVKVLIVKSQIRF